MKKILAFLLSLCFLVLFVGGCSTQKATANKTGSSVKAAATANKSTGKLNEGGTYTSKEDVALYLHTYHKLPRNYITKAEAQKLGWKREHSNTLDKIAPGKSIGGDRFLNAERKLPHEENVTYRECDIDYKKGNRGSKRLVFDNRGNIYYCGDHYNTFEKLY